MGISQLTTKGTKEFLFEDTEILMPSKRRIISTQNDDKPKRTSKTQRVNVHTKDTDGLLPASLPTIIHPNLQGIITITPTSL